MLFPGFHFGLRLSIPRILVLLLAMLFTSGCFQKDIRVEVSQEALAKANMLLMEGDAAFERKDYYAALIKYLEASRLNPNDGLMWNRLGIAYSQLKYYEESINAFKRSIKLNSKYANSVNNLGSAYFANRELRKAEKNFKKAIRMDPNEAIFHMNLGALYFEKKKIDKALAEWRKGLSLNPDILSKSTAISISVAGEHSLPKDKAFHFARIFAVAGNAPKAIEYLQKAVMDGFSDLNAIQREPDFDPIRNDEQFIQFMKDALLWISEKQ